MKKKSNNNYYFGEREEQAIRKFVKDSTTQEEKHELYNNIIHPAFKRLAENILNTYGMKFRFFEIDEDFDSLLNAGISFMYERLCTKFNPDVKTKNGGQAKAFSFFGTILKRYYIKESVEQQKSDKKNVNLDDPNLKINFHNYSSLNVEYDYLDDEKVFIKLMIKWFEDNVDIVFVGQKEKSIALSILELFKNINNIENFNKKYIYVCLREMTKEDTRSITGVIKKMKVIYDNLRYNYINTGEVISGSISL